MDSEIPQAYAENAIKLIMPVEGEVWITQGFGENPETYKQFGRAGHNGIDFGVDTSTPVLAAAAGVVHKIGNDTNGFGIYLVLDHGNYQTLYGHLQTVAVEQGDLVDVGDKIALSDSTGFSTGPHLHFGLMIPENKSNDYPAGETDPTPYFMAIEGSQPPGGQEAEAENATGQEEISTSSSLQDTQKTLYPTCKVNARDGLYAHTKPAIDSRIIGGFPFGQALQIVKRQGDFVGVLVWVHKQWIVVSDP
jgi:murein DD-endopeptidase MepM/ murein hydrolase activator NlpD